MTEPTKDKEVESNTKGKEKVETADHDDKSVSTNSSSSSEDAKKCMDAVDFFTRKAKDIVIGGPKKSEAKSAKSKRRKRSHGGMKRSISLRSGLSEIGMSFDSDSELTHAEVVTKKEQKGKGKGLEEGDVFQGSDTDDSDEVCRRMKKERKNSDDDADDSMIDLELVPDQERTLISQVCRARAYKLLETDGIVKELKNAFLRGYFQGK